MSRGLRWIAIGLVGCSSAQQPTYHQDVAPILEGRCVSCHQAGQIGGFALDSYAEAAPWAAAIADSVSQRRMPPWKAAPGHQQYLGDPSLTPDEIDILTDWAASEAPEGRAADAVPPLASLAVTLPRVDRQLSMPEAYTPVQAPDDYRCFIIDWTETNTKYITGYEVHPDNRAIVHHVTGFLVRPDTLMGEGVFDTFAAWDAEDPEPGYTCFGGPGGSSDLELPVQQLGAWVPGSGAVIFPEDTGIEVPPGSKIILQMHYNVANTDGQPDQTTLDVTFTDEVKHKGGFAPWLNAGWVLGGMEIAPGDPAVTYAHRGSPLGFFDFILGGDLDLSRGFIIHSAMLHMHQLGARGVTTVHRADGTQETLLEIPEWDFDWQLSYRLATPVVFGADDELEVACTWDNTQGAETVAWGEGSAEEMCVANLYISELP